MALRGKKPEAVAKRLKLFLYGPAGVGKSTAAVQFPKPYIIDAEKGSENYDALINAAGGAVFQTTDVGEVIQEVKSLLTTEHDYRTLVIDPITPLYQDLLLKAETKVGTDHGRHYGEADKNMRRLINLLMSLDMNVVMTSHAKMEYGDNFKKLGYTFDGWKRLDYVFDLVIELSKTGKGQATTRKGRVVKTRISSFPDGEEFDWSYESIKKRYDQATMEREAKVVRLASVEQVRELSALLTVVRLPEGTTEKWLSKAAVDTFDDMPADVIAKCIDFTKARIPSGGPAASGMRLDTSDAA